MLETCLAARLDVSMRQGRVSARVVASSLLEPARACPLPGHCLEQPARACPLPGHCLELALTHLVCQDCHQLLALAIVARACCLIVTVVAVRVAIAHAIVIAVVVGEVLVLIIIIVVVVVVVIVSVGVVDVTLYSNSLPRSCWIYTRTLTRTDVILVVAMVPLLSYSMIGLWFAISGHHIKIRRRWTQRSMSCRPWLVRDTILAKSEAVD